MVTPSKQWKWECFAHLISMQIVMVLASYPVPLSETEEDVMFWKSSASGVFTVKSADEI
jgi:uncharacterized protein YpmS